MCTALTACTFGTDTPDPAPTTSASATLTTSPDPTQSGEGSFGDAAPIAPITRTGSGTTNIAFAEPTQVAAMEIRCMGGISGAFDLVATAPDGARMTREPETIRCDGYPQFVDPMELTGYGFVTEIRTSVRLRGVPREFIVTVTPARPDPWAGYYDEVDTTTQGGSVGWGSFGSPDATTPHSVTDGTIEKGEHTVRVECEGPDAVIITLASAADLSTLAETTVRCGIAQDITVTTPTAEGLAYTLDSRGAAGAFRVTIDPRDDIPSP